MANLYEDWQKNYNLKLVAVSTDDQRTAPNVKRIVDGKGWEYEVLLDVKEDFKRALNFQEVPYTVVVNRTGAVVYKHAGYKEGDEYELEKKIAELQAAAKNAPLTAPVEKPMEN